MTEALGPFSAIPPLDTAGVLTHRAVLQRQDQWGRWNPTVVVSDPGQPMLYLQMNILHVDFNFWKKLFISCLGLACAYIACIAEDGMTYIVGERFSAGDECNNTW